MISRPRRRIRPRRRHPVRPAVGGGLVHLTGVVRAIGIDLDHRRVDWLQQTGEDFSIRPLLGRRLHRHLPPHPNPLPHEWGRGD